MLPPSFIGNTFKNYVSEKIAYDQYLATRAPVSVSNNSETTTSWKYVNPNFEMSIEEGLIIAWWVGKALSPACGPAAPVCAVFL